MKPTKPTKPKKPKGMGGASSARRGRLPGFSPLYTPEQTARYKSQALRYSKAVELGSGGPDHVEWNGQILSGDDAANLRDAGGRAFKPTDRVGFYFRSQRSRLDYWTVRYGGGGLEDVETFSDAITKTGTTTCAEPVVTWGWENPEFNWSAQTIKVCEGGSKLPDGASSYTLPPSFPGSYNPVPPGETRLVTVRSTSIRTDDFKLAPPNGNGSPGRLVTPPDVVSFNRVLTSADSFENFYQSGAFAIYGMDGTFGSASVLLNGVSINNNAFNGFTSASGNGDYAVQVFVTNVEILADGPLLAPPAPTPPPFDPTVAPPAVSPFPAATTKATAGGIFTSNVFTASSAAEIKATLEYTTVPDIGTIEGAIAVQLYDGGTDDLLDALSETPTNGGEGTLEHTFNLEADQSYYFKVVIPETCYCDAATVTIGGAGFVCDCPDYTKTQRVLLNSSYNSEQVDRDWSDSGAGCDQEGGGCKHCLAVRIFLGLPVEMPTDYPV